MADKSQVPDIHLLSNQSSAFVQDIVVASTHIAKGSKFDRIITPQAGDRDCHLEISRSMLCVAIARAMHRLTLAHSGIEHTPFI